MLNLLALSLAAIIFALGVLLTFGVGPAIMALGAIALFDLMRAR